MAAILPEGYRPLLNLYDTQRANGQLKSTLEMNLHRRLGVIRVTAPLFVDVRSCVNDSKAGTTSPVIFEVPSINTKAEVIQSLDKWKRLALYRYEFPMGAGLCCDTNGIRWSEKPDAVHSVYVDHWAWARVIDKKDYNLDTLYYYVKAVVNAICDTDITLRNSFPELLAYPELTRQVTYITAQELEDRYPELTPYDRENAIAKEYKTVFIRNVGSNLKSGQPHRRRNPDAGDWELSGELVFWDDVLGTALPITSMGIHVSPEALRRQLAAQGKEIQPDDVYYNSVLDGTLPYAVGGDIGQSRLSMLILHKAHIGEVHAGVWDDETREAFEQAGLTLL